MEVFVARQAILDRDRHVYGYELLFRSNAECDHCDSAIDAEATTEVVSSSLFAVGLEQLCGGKYAFVNFDREMLLQRWYQALPPKSTVIELLETVTPDPEVMSACKSLAQQGYRIALDDFVFHPDYEPLLRAASLVKIEIESVSRSQQEKMMSIYHRRGIKVLAEKVENYEQYEWARQVGYDFFQGYFFARPTVMRGQQIPAGKVHQLLLLQEIQPRQLDFDRLASLISEDVAFSYKLIRFASSALFSRHGHIRSIRQALVTLGEDNIRRWAALVTLSGLAEHKPEELVACSLIRAKCCALIGQRLGAEFQQQGFLMGLFSLLDALLERPLDEALAEVQLEPAIKAALLGLAPHGDVLSTLYKLVRHYERADWDEVGRLAAELRIPSEAAREAYCGAVHWANEALSLN